MFISCTLRELNRNGWKAPTKCEINCNVAENLYTELNEAAKAARNSTIPAKEATIPTPVV